MDFYYEVTEVTQSRLDRTVLERLDHDMFADYIDFNALESQLLNADNAAERNALRSITKTLYKMQLLLEESR